MKHLSLLLIQIIRQMQFYPNPTTVISGWYDTQDFLEIDTSQGAQTVKMMGVGEYNLQSTQPELRKKIALKIANGTTRPQFNSAKGANAQNDEADNLVTMMEYTGTGYAVSSLKGYIGQGGSFTTTEGRIVSAECIDTSITPSLACVCVRESGQTCPTDCTCSDIVEPTPPPTPAVSEIYLCVILWLWLCIICSHLMFISYLQPTISPTTPAPTPKPTPGPTTSPTVSAAPTEAPTPAPTPAGDSLFFNLINAHILYDHL